MGRLEEQYYTKHKKPWKSVSPNEIDLEWDAAVDDTGVTNYAIQKSLDGYTWDTEVNVGNVLYYTYSGLNEGTVYYFRIRALDAAGNFSNWSNTVSYKTETAANIAKELQIIKDKKKSGGKAIKDCVPFEEQSPIISSGG